MFAEQRICADTSSQCPLSFPWGNKGDLPGSPHTMSLVGFPREPISQAFRIPWIFIGNWWENQCISHMIKYTTGENLMEKSTHTMKKVWEQICRAFLIRWICLSFSMLWEIDEKTPACPISWSIPQGGYIMEKITHTMGKVWVQFPRFSQYDGFSYISPYHEKLMGKPIHFQYDEVYHMMGIWWGKSTHTMGKVWPPISHTVSFPSFSGIMGNWWGNPCISYMMRLVNLFLRNIVKKWQKQPPKVFCKKRCCQKFNKFHKKKSISVGVSF